MEFDETRQSKISESSYKFVFSGPIWKSLISSDRLIHFRLLLCNRNGIWRHFIGSKNPISCTKLVFWGLLESQDGRPSLWLAGTFLTSSLQPLNRVQGIMTRSKMSMPSNKFLFLLGRLDLTKLDRKQILIDFYQVCVCMTDQKTKMTALTS